MLHSRRRQDQENSMVWGSWVSSIQCLGILGSAVKPQVRFRDSAALSLCSNFKIRSYANSQPAETPVQKEDFELLIQSLRDHFFVVFCFVKSLLGWFKSKEVLSSLRKKKCSVKKISEDFSVMLAESTPPLVPEGVLTLHAPNCVVLQTAKAR